MKFFDSDKWQEIYYALRSNPLRTILTALSVGLALFMLVLMLGGGNYLRDSVFHDFKNFHFNSAFIWTRATSKPYKGFKKGRRFNFNNADIMALRKGVPEIDLLAPRINAWGNNTVVRGKETGAFNIYGDFPDWNRLDPYIIKEGRFVNDVDILSQRKVVAIGERVVKELFKKNEKPIGDYIKINGIYFKIVGVLKSQKSSQQAENENKSIHMPFTTLQKVYNYKNVVGWFGITTKKGYDMANVERKTIQFLKYRHDIHPDDNRAIGHVNVEEEFKKIDGLFNGITFIIWFVGIGTLLTGIIGVSNIMFVIVKERTKEIGIKRAIGAAPIKIIAQIIWEAIVLTFLSGFVGLILGILLIESIAFFALQSGASVVPNVDPPAAIISLMIIIIAGSLAGFFPALKAVKIKPIDALRYE